MKKPHYQFTGSVSAARFEFTSTGKTVIRKVVLFQPLDVPKFYNLVLADLNEDGSLDDESVSNNGDRDQILATVAQITRYFLNAAPEAFVYFSGGTLVRTQLYQMAINHALDELRELFDLTGINSNDQLEPFAPNQSYQGFVVSLRKR